MVVATVSYLLFAGCNGSPFQPSPPNVIFPDSNVSFRLHVQPFLRRGCALVGCHDRGGRSGGVVLEEYAHLWERPGLVVPGEPDASVLQQILEARLPHQPDPRELSTDNQRRGVRRWIAEGARYN
ncbi:MAG: hypothetical protein NZ473_07935 [Candidatus Kapabacteria bacterium]|nr:hypothetical protein [Candidatus Kapabacteria bacterium]MCS7169934.1 hypothetical protein [Candidatus Kapabacteria bacterium]MDW7997042.1 hypothetical protein [Bacteroidota bacterium]MDW8226063.1 hypothetical protein [Bacteroidota bacterium]